MRKQKISLILLAVAIFGIMGATAVEAYEMADSFGNPLSNNIVTENRFGQYLWYATKGVNQYHAGEDMQAVPKTPVFAVANGQVRQSKEGSTGYGNVVVIEHTLPDGNKIVSIYGHPAVFRRN